MRETADGGYLDRSVRIVQQILDADPANYDARRRNIESEMQRHHFQRVVAATGTLTGERPEDPIVWGLRGDAFMEIGEYENAADAYQRMTNLRPSLASYNRVAFYRFVTGDAAGAIVIMRKAIDMGSSTPENTAWCLAELGHMLFKTGEIDAAARAYNDALATFPGYHHAIAGMGRVMAVRGHLEEAAEAFKKAQSIAPLPEYAGWLAKLYRRIGEQDLARKQLAMLEVADVLGKAAGEAANRNMSLAFSDLDYKPARALELAQAELAIRHDVYTYDALAWALFKNGKYPEAARATEIALAQNTPEPSFREHAAKILEAAGRKESARRPLLQSPGVDARLLKSQLTCFRKDRE